jgi:hypothetical protein
MTKQIFITRQHLGIILTIIGTVFLGFSVGVTRQYKGEMAKKVARLKKESIELTETSINRSLFWIGLGLVALGSALQW